MEAITVGQMPEGVRRTAITFAVTLHNGSPRNKNHATYNDHGLMRIFKVGGTKLTLVTTAKIGTWLKARSGATTARRIIVQATQEKELQVFYFDGKEPS